MKRTEMIEHEITFSGDRKIPTWRMQESELEKVVSRLRESMINFNTVEKVMRIVRTVINTDNGYVDTTVGIDVTKEAKEIIARGAK